MERSLAYCYNNRLTDSFSVREVDTGLIFCLLHLLVQSLHFSYTTRLQPMSSSEKTFRELGLSEPLLRALDELGYEKPTPIDRKSVV